MLYPFSPALLSLAINNIIYFFSFFLYRDTNPRSANTFLLCYKFTMRRTCAGVCVRLAPRSIRTTGDSVHHSASYPNSSLRCQGPFWAPRDYILTLTPPPNTCKSGECVLSLVGRQRYNRWVLHFCSVFSPPYTVSIAFLLYFFSCTAYCDDCTITQFFPHLILWILLL